MPIQLPLYLDDENFTSTRYNPFVGIEYPQRKIEKHSMLIKKIKHKLLYYISKPILRIPLLNWMIISTLSYLLIKLTFHYHRLYTKSSIVATCLTNIVLFAISDTSAQSITAFKGQSPILSLSDFEAQYDEVELPQRKRTNSTSSVFVDYGEDLSTPVDEVETPTKLNVTKRPLLFDFHRFFGFVGWGFFMAFIQVAWYMFLNSMYIDLPYFVTVCARVLTDQLCFSPISLYSFFTYSTYVLESGSKADLYEKIKSIYLSTLVASYMVWVPVQFINFLVMPKNLQVPFSSSVGVIWNCFLSMKNAANAA